MTAALTIDLKGSRKYESHDRETIQRFIINITDYLNAVFLPSLLKELRFNGGDEIQGLFKDISAAYLCLRLFRRLVFPIKIHAGIGAGEWTTVIPERDTFYQDGSAYHNAREAIECAKRETDYIALMVCRSEKNTRWNAMMNAGFQLAEKNTTFQNDLAIILECMYPICKKEMIFLQELQGLQELMLWKNELSIFSKGTVKRRQPLFYNLIPSSNTEAIEEMWENEKIKEFFFYKYAHPYRAASTLAEVTRTTRQSIDTALKASNVYAERAIALALIEEM